MNQKSLAEKWTCSYLANETDADFKNLRLKRISRPKAVSREKDPWTRLYSTPTVSAVLRCYGDRPHTDSLQLCLDSTCNQSSDYPITKKEAVRQMWTREKRCFCKPVPRVIERPFDHPLHIAPFCETPTNIHYVKLAIDCPHISQTNNGYSRRVEDGNFFRS